MPTFGQHETGQRLHLSGVGALYVLKADDKKIIKVLQPPAGIWTDEQLREETDTFLLRARTQQELAKSSPNWAPIHEAAVVREGSEDAGESAAGHASGAYLVMDRYERSVQSLIDGRVNVNNDDLRSVMGGVIKGLRDLRKSLNRAHGNLKPSNILLANAADLTQATVHLADPAADGSLSADTDKKDFSDLAEILYELVNLRPYQGGTVPRTKDWDKLGPNGEDWRKLCNRFFDIAGGGGTAEDRNLDPMPAAIDTWRAKPKKSKLPLVAAAVFLLMIAGGITAFIFTRPPKLDFDQPRWERLCLEYHSWFSSFVEQLTSDDATKQKFSVDPYPTEVIKILNSAGRELERYQPRRIAKKPQSDKDLAISPTDDAKTGYGPYYTKQGVELIEKVSDALTPARWPLLTKLDETAATYEKRGWLKPAAGVRGLIKSARPPSIPESPADIAERAKLVVPVDMLANIDNTIKASATVIDIEKRWASIQDQIKKLPVTDVPLLQAFPKFAEDLPKSSASTTGPGNAVPQGTLADVQALSTSFNEIEKVVAELVTDLNRKDQPIVFEELAKDPAAQIPVGGKLTVEMYSALPAVTRSYVKLAQDPRSTVTWSQSLDEIQKEMIDKINEANPQDPNLQLLIQRRAAVEKEVAAFAPISPIEKNRVQLDTLVARAKDDLSKLTKDGGEWVAPYIIDPAEYIAKQRARLTSGPLAKATPAVYSQWKKAHNALLAKVAAAPQELKKYRVFKTVDEKFATLQNIYADFDQNIPAKVPGLSDIAVTERGDWKAVIATRVATVYREQALTDLMTSSALKWAEDLPQVNDPAYQSYARQRLQQFEQIRVEALALVDDYSTIQSRLDHLHLRPNEPVAKASTWRDLFAKWKGSNTPLLADGEITAALKPIADRTTSLLTMDNVNDYKSLVVAASSAAPEIVLTAWRKLGEVDVDEHLAVLDDENKAESHLEMQLETLAKAKMLDEKQVGSFAAEIKAQRPIRWHRYADVLSSAASIQAALDRRAEFAVTLSAQTDPNLVYDDALYQLRKQFEKNLKDAELKPMAQDFIKAVSAMPANVSKDKDIQDLLARIAKPLSQSAEESSSAGAGPKLAGWEQDANPNPNVRLFYSKTTPRYTLEFTRLQVGQKTIYLCTTEMSFGLFAYIVNSSNRFADLDNAGKSAAQAHWFKASDDPWDGPRVWKIVEHKFVPNPDWIFKSPQMGDNPHYPANVVPDKPGPDEPMQQLSPWAAMYVARLIGCRLPTSDEWKAAYDKFEANSAGPKDAWNLRGAGWLAQQQYALKMAAKGMQYPDQGICLSADQLFAGITADAAKSWTSAALARLAPNRITPGTGVYPTSQIWFRKVGTQPGVSAPGTGAGSMHDLVGNVAEYVFDGVNANAVIKEATASIDAVNAAINAGSKSLFVIGGSSLSPPEIPFNEKQPIDPEFAQTLTGFSDVGFRLAYTAPIDSISDVLAAIFKDPKYLPGSKAKIQR